MQEPPPTSAEQKCLGELKVSACFRPSHAALGSVWQLVTGMLSFVSHMPALLCRRS